MIRCADSCSARSFEEIPIEMEITRLSRFKMSLFWLIWNVCALFDDLWVFWSCELVSFVVFSHFLFAADRQGVHGISEIGAAAIIIGAESSKQRHIVFYGYRTMSAQEMKNWSLLIRCCFECVFDCQCVFDWVKMAYFVTICYLNESEISIWRQIRVWRI